MPSREEVRNFTRRGVARTALEMQRYRDGYNRRRRVDADTHPQAAQMLDSTSLKKIEQLAKGNKF